MRGAGTLTLVAAGLLGTLGMTACGGASATTPAAGTRSSPPAARTATGDKTHVAACGVDNLMPFFKSVSGGGTAGHETAAMVFVNKSKVPCSVRGFPKLSFLGSQGFQEVGSPFRHATGDTPEKIVLQPGKSANVSLLLADTGAAGPGCDPVASQGIAVALAGTGDRKVYAQHSETVCSAKGSGVAQVGPFVEGSA